MKKIILLSALLWIGFSSQAQLRHIKGIKGIGANGGLTQYGYKVSGEYIQFFSNKWYGSFRPTYEFGEYPPALVKYRSIGVDNTIFFTLLSVKESFYISIGSGLSLYYDEALTSGVEIPTTTKFGVNGAIDGEYYLVNQLSIYFLFNQNYFFTNPNWGRGRWMSSLGLRFYF